MRYRVQGALTPQTQRIVDELSLFAQQAGSLGISLVCVGGRVAQMVDVPDRWAQFFTEKVMPKLVADPTRTAQVFQPTLGVVDRKEWRRFALLLPRKDAVFPDTTGCHSLVLRVSWTGEACSATVRCTPEDLACVRGWAAQGWMVYPLPAFLRVLLPPIARPTTLRPRIVSFAAGGDGGDAGPHRATTAASPPVATASLPTAAHQRDEPTDALVDGAPGSPLAPRGAQGAFPIGVTLDGVSVRLAWRAMRVALMTPDTELRAPLMAIIETAVHLRMGVVLIVSRQAFARVNLTAFEQNGRARILDVADRWRAPSIPWNTIADDELLRILREHLGLLKLPARLPPRFVRFAEQAGRLDLATPVVETFTTLPGHDLAGAANAGGLVALLYDGKDEGSLLGQLLLSSMGREVEHPRALLVLTPPGLSLPEPVAARSLHVVMGDVPAAVRLARTPDGWLLETAQGERLRLRPDLAEETQEADEGAYVELQEALGVDDGGASAAVVYAGMERIDLAGEGADAFRAPSAEEGPPWGAGRAATPAPTWDDTDARAFVVADRGAPIDSGSLDAMDWEETAWPSAAPAQGGQVAPNPVDLSPASREAPGAAAEAAAPVSRLGVKAERVRDRGYRARTRQASGSAGTVIAGGAENDRFGALDAPDPADGWGAPAARGSDDWFAPARDQGAPPPSDVMRGGSRPNDDVGAAPAVVEDADGEAPAHVPTPALDLRDPVTAPGAAPGADAQWSASAPVVQRAPAPSEMPVLPVLDELPALLRRPVDAGMAGPVALAPTSAPGHEPAGLASLTTAWDARPDEADDGCSSVADAAALPDLPAWGARAVAGAEAPAFDLFAASDPMAAGAEAPAFDLVAASDPMAAPMAALGSADTPEDDGPVAASDPMAAPMAALGSAPEPAAIPGASARAAPPPVARPSVLDLFVRPAAPVPAPAAVPAPVAGTPEEDRDLARAWHDGTPVVVLAQRLVAEGRAGTMRQALDRVSGAIERHRTTLQPTATGSVRDTPIRAVRAIPAAPAESPALRFMRDKAAAGYSAPSIEAQVLAWWTAGRSRKEILQEVAVLTMDRAEARQLVDRVVLPHVILAMPNPDEALEALLQFDPGQPPTPLLIQVARRLLNTPEKLPGGVTAVRAMLSGVREVATRMLSSIEVA